MRTGKELGVTVFHLESIEASLLLKDIDTYRGLDNMLDVLELSYHLFSVAVIDKVGVKAEFSGSQCKFFVRLAALITMSSPRQRNYQTRALDNRALHTFTRIVYITW